MTRADLNKLIDELPDSAVRNPRPAREREADAESAGGSGIVYRSTNDFIAHLESVPPESR